MKKITPGRGGEEERGSGIQKKRDSPPEPRLIRLTRMTQKLSEIY